MSGADTQTEANGVATIADVESPDGIVGFRIPYIMGRTGQPHG